MDDFDQKAADWDSNPARLERAAAVAQGIRESVPLTPGMTALEYGCGTGLLSFALQPSLAHITLADSSSGMLSVLNEKIASSGIRNMTSMQVDFITDPLPPVKVQLVYTLMTLHHIPDTDKILKEFYTLLDQPGYLCVADLDQEDGSFHGPDFPGHKGFDRSELAARVRQAGFRKVAFKTIFHTPRTVETGIQYFPLFLMTAEK
jgi:ubiquinone/menaquinone biosynthesis C-methylase UbiE